MYCGMVGIMVGGVGDVDMDLEFMVRLVGVVMIS